VEGLGSESYIGEIRVSVHRGKLDFSSWGVLKEIVCVGCNVNIEDLWRGWAPRAILVK
jgi:hypothetical protein